MSVEQSDDTFREWMRGNLARAAVHFGLAVTGAPVYGWGLRSISVRALAPTGPCWLRVLSEKARWATGDYWTGNTDANSIPDVPKPYVSGSHEWGAPEADRRVRAEVMTLLPGQPCSPTEMLTRPLDLPETWWAELRRTLDVTSKTPTTRYEQRAHGVSSSADQELGIEVPITEIETVHGDLHWANLLTPQFGLLDWEFWGCGPAGMDAASLYCNSLLVPDVAAKVREVFADRLGTPSGHAALLHTAAGVLRHNPNPELARRLHALVTNLLTKGLQ
jgi:hypothetical protein